MEAVPISPIVRPQFFEGQRLTADDLSEAFGYERELRWLHNRSLHGWGIAAGFAVTGARDDTTVTIAPGYAIDCAGRDIVLEHARIEVPRVASESTWHLTVSYAADEDLAAEERRGACDTQGAVRLFDEPRLRWLDATGKGEERLRPGLDIVLARAAVRGCKLQREPSPSARRQLARTQPYVFAGQTPVGSTPWRSWPESDSPAGVATTVSTAAGGFLSTPVYQARLAGFRLTGNDVVDGFAMIAEASPSAFEFRVILPAGEDLRVIGPEGAGLPLNSAIDLDVLRGDLQWHVVWMGVEHA